MTANELMAIAAHLHVLLRRKTGRVTDIEWLMANSDYAKAIAQFAKAKAAELADADLQSWALKLEVANQSRTVASKPLVQAAVDAVRANQVQSRSADFMSTGAFKSEPAEPERGADDDSSGPRYVGGIR